jgi:hypothetical protein
MDTIYEIFICIDGQQNMLRGVHEYKILKNDSKSNAMMCSKEGSSGSHTIHERALDAQYHYKTNGLHFYTKDESKLKEYGNILDEHMEKVIHKRAVMLKKSKNQLGTKWR